MSDIAIKTENLRKVYKLGEYGSKTLIEDLQRRVARARGKEDPNSIVDEDCRFVGNEIKALDGIDLEVKKGEALGIIGANGSGKSTLLKIISRITAPTDGEVGINGRIASMLEVGTGFNPAMTGRENIYLNGAILGMSMNEINEKLNQIIEFSECAEFIDTPVKRYSSGMFVKLAFSVAAHLNSEILLLDEVLSVGDVKFQTKCMQKMSEISKDDNRTILYVSHTMSTIRRLCTRCIVLDKGKKIFDGDTDEAIGIYLGGSRETQLRYNVKDIQRPSTSHGLYMRMQAIEFDPNDDFRYRCGEKVGLTVTWQSDIDVDRMFFRAEIQSSDGLAVGVSESTCIGESHAGQTRHTHLLFDTTELAEGHYLMMLDLYSKNEDGSFLTYDRPIIELPFIVNPAHRGEICWQPQVWGRTRLLCMQANDVEE